jgi:hypothetical protein
MTTDDESDSAEATRSFNFAQDDRGAVAFPLPPPEWGRMMPAEKLRDVKTTEAEEVRPV